MSSKSFNISQYHKEDAIKLELIINVLAEFAVRYEVLDNLTVYAFAVLYAVIETVALLLNGLVIYLFLSKKLLRTLPNIVTSNLIWNSLLLVVGVIPMTLVELCDHSLKPNLTFIGIRTILSLAYTQSNGFGVIIISVNRMNFFLKCSTDIIGNVKVNKEIGAIVLTYFSAFATPFLTGYGIFIFGLDTVTYIVASLFILCTISVICCYNFITYKVRRSKRSLSNHQDTHVSNDNTLRKLKKTVNLLIGCYILTFLPVCLFEVAMITVSDEYYYANERCFNRLYGICFLIIALNSIINPLVYFYSQDAFKKEIYKVFWIKYLLRKLNVTVEVT